MKKTLKLSLAPEIALNHSKLQKTVQARLQLPDGEPLHIVTRKRSIDARKSQVRVHLELEIYQAEALPEAITYQKNYDSVASAEPVLVIGAGPAGLFAALRLIELGLKPVILERGKDVRARRRDLAAINKDHIINPNSNYCFGEGGAGTYSDGKLYTRSKKRGDVQQILQILAAHGAPEDILVDSHPHIGTNKLPKVIQAIRETILEADGDILFNSAVTDLIIRDSIIKGVVLGSGQRLEGKAVVLATGHSARDIYTMLHEQGILVEVKPFALGIRVEHPQPLIDKIQYHRPSRGLLPAASYTLNHQIRGPHNRGVFSFCMCPGGFIVPAATSPGELVLNGMSPSRRDSKFANSGIVATVAEGDFSSFSDKGPLSGMYFQKSIETRACSLAGGTQAAPAQRLMDFLGGKLSADLPETSYQPGVVSVDMKEVLPPYIAKGIKEAFRVFGKRMKGYLTNEAQLMGVESRTSAPVRIPRDPMTLQHPQVRGLVPCGEGAGYAGGIVSAALDGIRCAEAVCGIR